MDAQLQTLIVDALAISKPTISFFRVVQAKNAEKRWEVKSKKKTQVPSPKKLIAFWVA